MYYKCETKEKLNSYLDNPDFVIYDVYGDKPNSKTYKLGSGSWVVSGYFKSEYN
tara:strand:- start:974 stop:1135 length:162 start_codon:yes stop_codon:yes gene_type:complete